MSSTGTHRTDYVGTVQARLINGLQYYVNGRPFASSDLVNDTGFVTAADSPHADWTQADSSVSSFIANKPALAAVATSGSAGDLTSGTLPTGQVPYLDCDQIASGVFPITRLPIIPAGFISGLAPLATSGNLWTGANVATLDGNTPTPLGAGGFVAWNRDGASGLTAFTNNKGAYAPGGWEWVSYRSDQTLEGVAASLSSAGVLNVAGGYAVGGAPLAAVAMSGSASDITTGTLPSSVLPQIPANNVSSGSYQSDLVPASPNQYNIGSSSEPWATVWAQGLYMNGSAVARVATSASASDLSTGTLAVARLPPMPAAQIGSGSFAIGSFGCDVVPSAASSYSLGSAAAPWKDLAMTGTLRVGGGSLQPVALSGSASDLATGTLPLTGVPRLPAAQVVSGTFTVGSFGCSVLPATGGLSLGTASSPWTNLNFTNGGWNGVLSGGGRTDRCQLALAGSGLLPGSTAYIGFGVGTNGSTAPGALEAHVDRASSDFVWYQNTTELLRVQGGGNVLPGATNAQCLGYFGNQWQFVFANQFWRNGQPLQAVCTSGSASDLQTGTLPLGQVPALPPSQISVAGTFGIDLVPATANTLRVGTPSAPWGSVFAQQLYRNGTALAAVATSGAWSDMQQPAAVQGTPALNVTAPGFYFAYGRTPGSGTTSLVSQRGQGATGGFEFLSYGSGNTAEGGPLLALDRQGNASVAGALTGLGAGGLLMRSWDESAPATAGAKTHRFQGRPVGCVLVPALTLANFAVGASGQTTAFACRLSGCMQPPSADTYTFQATFKDGVRIWVNNLPVVNSWVSSGSATTATWSSALGTQVVPIMIEYFQTTGASALQIQWKGASNNTAYQPLAHGDYRGGAAFSLYYDMYENPPAQLGTTWVNGPLYANAITNNGSGVQITDSVDFGGNALYGVSFLNNKGSPIAVGDALALASKPVGGVSSLGIGTPSPAVPLDVFGAANNGQVHITATDLNEASIGFGGRSNNATFSAGNCWVMGRGSWSSGANMGIGVQGTGGVMYITGGSSPSVGINQATPAYSLDVTGTGRFTGTLYAPQIVTNSVTTNSSNNSFGNTLFITSGTGVSVLKSTATCALDVAGDAAVSGTLTAGGCVTPQINANGAALTLGASIYCTGGSSPMVGVLQSSPAYTLDVSGTVRGTNQVIAGETVTGAINKTAPQPLTINNLLTLTTGSSPMLGVGQTVPNATLDVTGTMRATTRVTTAELRTSAVNADYSSVSISNLVSVGWGGSGGSTPFVGVNQATPASTLDVAGSGRFTQGLAANAGLTTPTVNPGGAATTISNSVYCTGGNVPKLGVNNSSPAATCDVTGTLAVSGASTLRSDLSVPTINTGGGALSLGNFVFFTGGNTPALGIVQTDPQYTLDVTGNCRVTGPVYGYSVVTASVSPPGSTLTLGGAVVVQTGSSPQVGINQPSPAATLDVSGTARVTGVASLGGAVTPSVAAPAGTVLGLGGAVFVTNGSTPAVGLFTQEPQAAFDCRGAASFSATVTAAGLETQTLNASTNALQVGGLLTLTAGGTQMLGVGTSTPGATLDVAGSFRVSGATTFSSPMETSAINPDGATLHIGNCIHFVGGSTPMVGIMQTSPQYTLDVTGNTRVSGPATLGGVVTPSIGNGGSGIAITETANINAVSTPTINAGGSALALGGTVWVAGNQVGIMQPSPQATLDCTGNANFTGAVTVGGLSTPVINSRNAALSIGTQVTLTGSKMGVFNTSPSATLDLTGTFACSGTATLGGVLTPAIDGDGSGVAISKTITCTGGSAPKVGILTGSPAAELDVRGNVNVSQTCTAQYVNAAQVNQNGAALTLASSVFLTGGSSPMVGILQRSPAYTLDVAGNCQVTGPVTAGAVLAKGSTLPVGGVITCVPGSAALGVNNASPAYTLDVAGNANVSGSTILGGLQTSSINAGGQALTIGPSSAPAVAVTGGSAPKVGIAQAVPAYTLDVSGTARASTALLTPSVNTSGQPLNVANTMWFTGSSNNTIARVGILNSNPQNTVDVTGNAFVSQSLQSTGVITPYIALAGQSGHTFDITSSGVGLYQSVPQFSLDITGNLRATAGLTTPSVAAPSDALKLGSNVYANGGRVGVYQPSPGSGAIPSSMPSGTTLDVAGVVRFLGTTNELCFMQSQTGGGGSAYMALGDAIATNDAAFIQYNNNGGSTNSVYLGLYPTQDLTLTASGVGVFQLNPQYPLDVGGNANVSNTLSAAAVRTGTVASGGTLSLMAVSQSSTVTLGGSTGSPTLTAINGMLGVQQSNPGATLDVSGNARVAGNAAVSSLSTGTIGNGGSGVSFGSDAVTVSKMVLPQAASFTGNVNELAGTTTLLSAAMPVGTVLPWSATSGNALPTGFVECVSTSYAPALSKYAYYSLYKLLSYTYGGDGNSTFAVPDVGGQVICGYVPSANGVPGDSRFPESGYRSGHQTITLDTSMMPSHGHGLNDPLHSHQVGNTSQKFSANGNGSIAVNNINSSYGNSTPGNGLTDARSTGISIQSTGGGGAHDNMQPYVVMRYLIKVGPNNPSDLVMAMTSNAGTAINAVKTGDLGYLNTNDVWSTYTLSSGVTLKIGRQVNSNTYTTDQYTGPATNAPFTATTGFFQWNT